MQINRAYKTELKLTNKEASYFVACAGAARFSYNWGLARKIEAYEATGQSPTASQLHKDLNQLKKGELSWMYDYSKCIPQQALRDLDQAYTHFFRRVKTGEEKAGFPRFKSKHTAKKSFYLEGAIKVTHEAIKLPRIGWVRLKEQGYLPTDGVHILSARITERAGRWFVSVSVEEEIPDNFVSEGEVIGVDLGINRLASCSNGAVIDNPKHLRRSLKQLKRAQRALSRKKKGSRNRAKARMKVAKLHLHISNQRKDTIHQGTSEIVAKTKPLSQRPMALVLEDLNVKGMTQNHKLAQAIHDASMSEIRRQLTYKAEWCGIDLLIADRWFPSSKHCSSCGQRKTDLTLADRVYRCESCGVRLDRDLNAAMNLAQLYNAEYR